jgi:hypothetical protein
MCARPCSVWASSTQKIAIMALLSQARQTGPTLVATGATMTTTAARQLLRGRSPFRGEWEHTPCSLFGECMRSKRTGVLLP